MAKPIHVDTAFLENLVKENSFHAKNAEVQQELAARQKETLGDLIEEAGTPPARQVATKVKRLQHRAEQLDAANPERIEREEKPGKTNLSQREAIGDAVQESVSNIRQGASSLADRVGSVQTAGGIGLLLVILLVLLFAIVRINASGDTRLKQFWYMLNGRATLQGAVTPQSGSIPGTETSGNPFGLQPGFTDHTLSTNGQYRTITSNF